MAKYYGRVGYSETVEQDRIWQEELTWRYYYGDVIRNSKRWDTADKVNDDISVNNSISIVADAYAFDHFFAIRCVEWQGHKWKVASIDVEHPRLILNLGGLYER